MNGRPEDDALRILRAIDREAAAQTEQRRRTEIASKLIALLSACGRHSAPFAFLKLSKNANLSADWEQNVDKPTYARWWVMKRLLPAALQAKPTVAELGASIEDLCAPETNAHVPLVVARRSLVGGRFLTLCLSAEPKVYAAQFGDGLAELLTSDALAWLQYHDFFDLAVERVRSMVGGSLVSKVARSAPTSAGNHGNTRVHGEDFTWVRVGGQAFVFRTGNQAATIKCLWEEAEKSGFHPGCGMSELAIAIRIGASEHNFTIRHLFRKHPAKGTFLKSTRAHTWALDFELT